MPKIIFWLITLISGFSGLGYQILWSDQLGVLLGSAQWAITLVLAMFMAGLTAGSVVSAVVCERLRKPLLWYAVLEIGIAALAMLLPLIWSFLDQIVSLNMPWGVRATMLASVLIIPTFFMGATLPVLVQSSGFEKTPVDRSTTIYGLNTLGAAIGALVCGFLILPKLGQIYANLVLVAGNTFAALAALYLLWVRNLPSVARQLPQAMQQTSARSVFAGSLPLVIAFLCGLSTFAYEIIWTRMLVQIHGADVYGFSAMLAVLLCGLGLGALLAGWFRRWSSSHILLISQSLLLLMVAFSFHAVLNMESSALTQTNWASVIGQRFASTSLALFPATVLLGMGVPLVVRWFRDSRPVSGRYLGQVYAINTLGAIVGAVGVGYWLIAVVALEWALAVIMTVNGLVILLLVFRIRPSLPVAGFALLMSVIGISVVAQTTSEPIYRKYPLTQNPLNGPLVMAEMGTSASVATVETRNGWRVITNGLPESLIPLPGVDKSPVSAAYWLTLLPLSLHENPQSMFVAGFGGGVSVEAIPPGVMQVQVAEIEAKVLKANRQLDAVRAQSPFADPRVQTEVEDAKVLLRKADTPFDIIVSQPSHPWTSGSAYLYSTEYFELVSRSLNEDGIFSLWMGLKYIDQALMEDLLYTLQQVFTDVQVFAPGAHKSWVFLASNQQLPAIDARAYHRHASYWHPLGVFDATQIQAAMLLNDAGVRAISQDGEIISARHNQMKFGAPKVLANPLDSHGAFQLVQDHDVIHEWKPEPQQNLGFLLLALRTQPAYRLDAFARQSPALQAVAGFMRQPLQQRHLDDLQIAQQNASTRDMAGLLYLDTRLPRLLKTGATPADASWLRAGIEAAVLAAELAMRERNRASFPAHLASMLTLVEQPTVLRYRAAVTAAQLAVMSGDTATAAFLISEYAALFRQQNLLMFRLAIVAKNPFAAVDALLRYGAQNRNNPSTLRMMKSGFGMLNPFRQQLQSDFRYRQLQRLLDPAPNAVRIGG